MSLSVDGVWKAGVWATTVWADGVWSEGAAVPAPSGLHGGDPVVYEEKYRKKRWLLEDERKVDVRKIIQRAFVEESLPEAVAAEVKELAEPYVEQKAKKVEIDWEGLQKADQALKTLLALVEELEIESEDEEVLLV